MIRFAFGIGIDFSFSQTFKAARAAKKAREASHERYLDQRLVTDFFLKQELLPVTNYLPDVAVIKKNNIRVFMAAGRRSLDKERFYAETAQILADRLGCELVTFPGHHGSFLANRLFGCLISPILRRLRLLLYPQNRVLRRLRDSEFHDYLSWNLDFLLCLGINPGARFSLLLHKLAKTGQDKFAVLFDRFVGEVAERIEEYPSGFFVSLSGCSECGLKFGLGHL
jgi:hypothetical protein